MGFLRPAEPESGGSRAPLAPASALSLGSYLNSGSGEEGYNSYVRSATLTSSRSQSLRAEDGNPASP